jgi:tRNA (guanine-N7-)-methyltransferase
MSAAPIHPPQRSFKPRRRGLSPSRFAAYERAMSKWGIALEGPQLSLAEVFGDSGDVSDIVLDIGFGGGEALIELAELRPHEQVIGVDIHTPGIAAVLEAIASRGLRNVRVVDGDVIDFLARIPSQSLSTIRAFFPDPWPKHRQRSRRLIRPDVVGRLVPLLRVGGTLHLSTDDAGYAAQMRRVCDAEPTLRGGMIERPTWRPITRFEQRGIGEGHRSVDLLYIVSESSPSDSSSALR